MSTKIETLLQDQDLYFKGNYTLDLKFRVNKLKQLKANIKELEAEITAALNKDLGKSEFEAFSTEIGMVQSELSLHIKKLKKWACPQRVQTPLIAFPSRSYVHKQPFGRVLVISPFNYPFSLAIMPVAAAVLAGNTVVLKPSEYTNATSQVLEKLIKKTFDSEHVSVVQGGIETNKTLLAQRWDQIFFTGSTKVGKIVLEAASKHLTPVVLELGGKNPCVVDKDANLKVVARRIAWAKLVNAGQTCIAPDYLYVHQSVKEEFLKLLVSAINEAITTQPKNSIDYARIVNKDAINRLKSLLQDGEVYYGGDIDETERYFQPTILTNVNANAEVMKDEIFGPILPVLEFTDLEEVIENINKGEKPLAAYYCGENKKQQDNFVNHTYSGDAGINELIMHFANHNLPFGGVGYSGMGSYHGKRSFDIFSHERSVIKTPTRIDMPFRYSPSKQWVLNMLRLLLK